VFAPQLHDTAPLSLNEAKKELKDLKKALFNFRRGHWVFWWGVGILFFGISACYFKGWRFILLFALCLLSLTLAILTWKGIINPAISRSDVNHVEEDRYLRRIAFLEGYIQSEKNRP
jgi:hypothetical protein